MEKVISKSQFKPKALKYFREVQESGQALKISPFSEEPKVVLKELRNSVLYYENPLEPVAQDDWEALK